mmetsp:Transcript_62393/g.97106  ORF Transcript_62393/g.97106 Transcript_62393/m.97106 type:complete len:175 (+) Transcript_62393:382-906(+)
MDACRLELLRSEALGDDIEGPQAVGDVGLLRFAEGDDGRLGKLLLKLEKKLATRARAGEVFLSPRDAGDGGLFGCGDSVRGCDCGLADAEDGLIRHGVLDSTPPSPSLCDPGFGEAEAGLPTRMGFVSFPNISSNSVDLADPVAFADDGRDIRWNGPASAFPDPSDTPDDLALR